MLNTMARISSRQLLREDGVDDEPVWVVDVDLAVAGGHCKKTAVWWPAKLSVGG